MVPVHAEVAQEDSVFMHNTVLPSAPVNEVILCRVFNAKFVALDYIGLPVGDAQVEVTFANGTVIHTVTANDGTVSFPLIPLGTFNAEISYLGTSTTVAGDASNQAVATGRVFSSIPTFVLIATVAMVAVLIVVVLVRRQRSFVRKKLQIHLKEIPNVTA